MQPAQVLAFWTPSPLELVIILIIALLLFGKRLPEVAKSLGKGIVEFKKGVKGIEDDVDKAHVNEPRKQIRSTEPESAPRYDQGQT